MSLAATSRSRATVPPVARLGLAAPAKFYAHLRDTSLLGEKLTQGQVDGCEAVLAASAGWGLSWAAYGLATPAWETDKTMQPIRERGNGDGPDADKWDDYLERYDTGRLAASLGNTPQADGDGVLYAGKGYVQITGLANYRKAGLRLGLPLVSNPDLALRPDVAAKILRLGMEEGWFTSKRLSTYLPTRGPATRKQFSQARRIINGLDRAAEIAELAMVFQSALMAGGWREPA